MGFSDALGDFGGAASSLFAGFGQQASMAGDMAASASYSEAAKYAFENAQYEKISTSLKETGLNRQILMAEGKTSAEVAGAGFTQGGSAGDIMRSGASQGALAKSTLAIQGAINYNSRYAQGVAYDAQASAAASAAAAAGNASFGSFLGAGMKLGMGLLAL